MRRVAGEFYIRKTHKRKGEGHSMQKLAIFHSKHTAYVSKHIQHEILDTNRLRYSLCSLHKL